jgi:hypothetical protein
VAAIEDRERAWLQAGQQLIVALGRSRHLPVTFHHQGAL